MGLMVTSVVCALWHEVHELTLPDDQPRPQTANCQRQTANSFDDMKAGGPKGLDCLRQLRVSHQHIVGIKGTDG
jgi:hypothetical protein